MALTVTAQVPSAGAASTKLPSSSTSVITVKQATSTSLAISWQRVRKAAGYDLYLDGTRVAKTQATAYTFTNLRCGITYTLGLDSFNARGARSTIFTVLASTSACQTSTGGNDTSPPTSPTSLSQGATTATNISLLWGASRDDVGVAGYELFLNGNKVGSTAATSYTFGNLRCGTSYALAVDAFDAAGNRSQSTVVQASTGPCADISPPTTPALPTQSAATATSISLVWGGSLDDVGVAGYELFLNGSKVGTTTATTYAFGGLSCGTSYTLAVDAFDATGNRSQQSSLSAATSSCASPPSLPSPNNCTATLAAGGNVVSFVNGLSPGAVGCLRAGTYGTLATDGWNHFTASGTATSPITIKSFPGEVATIQGYTEVGSNNVVLTNLKIDTTNNTTVRSCPSGGYYYGSFTLAGNNIVVDHDDISASDRSRSANGVLVTGSNDEIRFNKIHDVGRCRDHDHGIYDEGTGTQIHDNWIWNIPNGWGVQLYPSDSNTHIYANVIDRASAGFVVCSTGSNNLIEHNVVSNSVGGSQTGPGALVSGCGPQGSSTNNVVRNNDSFNNSDGVGSVAGIALSGNLSVDPMFADAASHDYQTLSSSPLLSWSLWTGS